MLDTTTSVSESCRNRNVLNVSEKEKEKGRELIIEPHRILDR